MPLRVSYEQSCIRLQGVYLYAGCVPSMPDKVPRYDDDAIGVRFYKTLVKDDVKFRNLTLPRTFIGRSEINNVDFSNTDFKESNFCWNDFIKVDFSDADISFSDLRSSVFRAVKFVGSILRNSDLRGSKFMGCDFTDADLSGAIAERMQMIAMKLSAAQIDSMVLRNDAGTEPEGG